jgi:hypothetical protein
LEKLTAYRRSEELVKLLSEKLGASQDPQAKNYLVSKLKLTGTNYADFIADSLQT